MTAMLHLPVSLTRVLAVNGHDGNPERVRGALGVARDEQRVFDAVHRGPPGLDAHARTS